MSGNGQLPGVEEVPHIDIVIRLFPTMNQISVLAPENLQAFAVLGLLEEAKMIYREAVKARSESRIVAPNLVMMPPKVS